MVKRHQYKASINNVSILVFNMHLKGGMT